MRNFNKVEFSDTISGKSAGIRFSDIHSPSLRFLLLTPAELSNCDSAGWPSACRASDLHPQHTHICSTSLMRRDKIKVLEETKI
jgi:hypothetical protein